MSNLVYLPRVEVNERDLTNNPQLALTRYWGEVINAEWGPCNTPFVTNDYKTLKATFGYANKNNETSYGSVSKGLRYYGSGAVVVRAIEDNAGTSNASAGFGTDDISVKYVTEDLILKVSTTLSDKVLASMFSEVNAIPLYKVVSDEVIVKGYLTTYTYNSGKTALILLVDDGTTIVSDVQTSNFAVNDVIYLDKEKTITLGTVTAVTEIVGNFDSSVRYLSDEDALPVPDNEDKFYKLTFAADLPDSVKVGSVWYDSTTPNAIVVAKLDNKNVMVYLVDSGLELTGSFDFESTAITGTSTNTYLTAFLALAKFPGVAGNNFKVSVFDSTNYTAALTFLKSLDGTLPNEIGENELVIAFSGTAPDKSSIAEVYRLTDKTSQNAIDIFVNDVNQSSSYIKLVVTNYGAFNGTFNVKEDFLTGGNSLKPGIAAVEEAYDNLFSYKENYMPVVLGYHDVDTIEEVKELTGYGMAKTQQGRKLITFFDSLPKSESYRRKFKNKSTDHKTEIEALKVTGTGYIHLSNNHQKYFEPTIGKYVYLPCSVDAVGLVLRIDYLWIPIAGENTGVLSGTGEFYYPVNLSDDLQELYLDEQINPVTRENSLNYFVDQLLIWPREKSTSECNVRLNLNEIYNQFYVLLSKFKLTLPGENQRSQINNVVDDQFLKIRSGLGAFDLDDGDNGYKWTCDLSINGPEDRNHHRTNCKFACKPILATKYIIVDAIVTQAGVNLEEL